MENMGISTELNQDIDAVMLTMELFIPVAKMAESLFLCYHDVELLGNLIKKGNKVVITMGLETEDVKMAENLVNDIEKELMVSCETCKAGLKDTSHTHWPANWFFHIQFDLNCHPQMVDPTYSLPNKIFFLPNVESISVTRCGLKILSHNIGLLRNLKTLNLERNHLQSLPQTLIFCKELTTLRLANNRLSYLPGFIIDMPNLTVISKNRNSWSSVQWSCNVQWERILPIEPAVDDKPTVIGPESLSMLCIAKVCSLTNHDITNSNFKLLPLELKSDLLSSFKDLSVCCCCRGSFFQNNFQTRYKLDKCFANFRDYSMVPMTALCCSLCCAEKLERKWIKLGEEEFKSKSTDVYCFDVDLDIDKLPHEHCLCERRPPRWRRWIPCS